MGAAVARSRLPAAVRVASSDHRPGAQDTSSPPPRTAAVLRLQRTIGNRAVGDLLASAQRPTGTTRETAPQLLPHERVNAHQTRTASRGLAERNGAPLRRLVRDGTTELTTSGVINILKSRYPSQAGRITFKTVNPHVKKPEVLTLDQIATALSLGTPGSLPQTLKQQIQTLLGKVPATVTPAAAYTEITRLSEDAVQKDRDDVYADKTLLATAKTKLGMRDYIGVLGKLRVVENSTTGVLAEGTEKRHTPAGVADSMIRENFAEYVAQAVKAGKKISGHVAVVTDADFRDAYQEENGRAPSGTNAFVRVSSDRMVIVHSDRGNAGTTIHEGMHRYSDLSIKNRWGQAFNEAATEYCTREITDNLNPAIVRGNYANNLLFGRKLANLVGPDVLKQAYFNGMVGRLVLLYTTKTRRQAADLDTAADHMTNGRWAQAMGLLDPL